MTLVGSVGRWHGSTEGKDEKSEASKFVLAKLIERSEADIAHTLRRIAADKAILSRERKELRWLKGKAKKIGLVL